MARIPASNAYYAADVLTFVATGPDEVLGETLEMRNVDCGLRNGGHGVKS